MSRRRQRKPSLQGYRSQLHPPARGDPRGQLQARGRTVTPAAPWLQAAETALKTLDGCGWRQPTESHPDSRGGTSTPCRGMGLRLVVLQPDGRDAWVGAAGAVAIQPPLDRNDPSKPPLKQVLLEKGITLDLIVRSTRRGRHPPGSVRT